jgi:hypothetical protein
MPRTLILFLLLSCQPKSSSLDIWSAAELLEDLHDKGQTLPCVSDPALYIRVLWPQLDKSPMPEDHFCKKNHALCIQEAKKAFCQSDILKEIESEKEAFMIP